MEETTKSTKVSKKFDNPKKLRSIDVELAQKLNTGSNITKSSALNKLRSVVKNEKLTEIQQLKIWKGLFLSLYNTDKPVIQEEVSKNISKLTTLFKDYKDSLTFIKCFFVILQKHWDYIDQYRVDKFYSLTRKMLNSSFQLLKNNYTTEQEEKRIINDQIYSGLVKVFKSTVLNPEKGSTLTNGVVLHFSDIYLEELFKVCQGHIEPGHLTKILLPFVNFLTKSQDDVSCKRVKERVFIRLLTTYSPFDKKDAYYLPKVGVETEDSTPDIFPTDYETLSKLFFKCASSRDTPEPNRKELYALKNHFKRAQNALEELEELADNIVLDENGDIVENPYINAEDLEGDDSEEDDDEEAGDEEEELEGEEELEDEEDDDDEEFDEAKLDDISDVDSDEFDDGEEEEEEIVVPPPKNNKSKPAPKQQPAKPTVAPKKQSPAKQQPQKKQSPAKQQPKSKQQSPAKPTASKVAKKSNKK